MVTGTELFHIYILYSIPGFNNFKGSSKKKTKNIKSSRNNVCILIGDVHVLPTWIQTVWTRNVSTAGIFQGTIP